MRRLALIAGALALVVVLALGVMVISLNRIVAANREAILAEVQSLIRRPVTVGDMRVHLGTRIGVVLTDLVVGDDPRVDAEPLLRASRVTAALTLWPLLDRRLEVAHIEIDAPIVRMVRAAAGGWNYESAALPPPAGTAATSPEVPPAAAFALLVQSALVRDGTVIIIDQRSGSELTTSVRHIDLRLDDVRLDHPILFELGAAIDSDKPNLDVAGCVGPLTDSHRVPLTMQGKLGPFAELALVVDHLDLQAVITKHAVEIAHLTGDTLGGSVAVAGSVGVAIDGPVHLTGEVRGVRIRRLLALLPKPPAQDIDGKGFVRFDLNGVAGATLVRSLVGTVAAEVRHGVVRGVNLAAIVVDQLATLPLVGKQIERLKPKYRAVFARTDTHLQEASATFRIADGEAHSDDVRITADDLGVQAAGRVTIDEDIDVAGTAALSSAFSTDLIRDVRELRYVVNDAGQLAVPFELKGKIGQAALQFDDDFLSELLTRAVSRGAADDLVDRFLGKRGKTSPTPHAKDPVKELGRQLRDMFKR